MKNPFGHSHVPLSTSLMEHMYRFVLYPKLWEENKLSENLKWKGIAFNEANTKHIPKQPGIYAFILQNRIGPVPVNNYVFYIGITERTLQQRYKEYIREAVTKKRPKVGEMFRLFADHLYFYHTILPAGSMPIKEIEEKLLDTFIPPINENDYSVGVGAARKVAFK